MAFAESSIASALVVLVSVSISNYGTMVLEPEEVARLQSLAPSPLQPSLSQQTADEWADVVNILLAGEWAAHDEEQGTTAVGRFESAVRAKHPRVWEMAERVVGYLHQRVATLRSNGDAFDYAHQVGGVRWGRVSGIKEPDGFQVELALHEFANRVLHLKAELPPAITWGEFRHLVSHLGCQLVEERVLGGFAQLKNGTRNELLAPFTKELSPLADGLFLLFGRWMAKVYLCNPTDENVKAMYSHYYTHGCHNKKAEEYYRYLGLAKAREEAKWGGRDEL